MKKFVFFLLIIFCKVVVYSQTGSLPRVNQFVDIAGTIGSSEGSVAGSYIYNWRIGKKRKWEAGFRIRSTSYL